jgi:hypothetical protein
LTKLRGFIAATGPLQQPTSLGQSEDIACLSGMQLAPVNAAKPGGQAAAKLAADMVIVGWSSLPGLTIPRCFSNKHYEIL